MIDHKAILEAFIKKAYGLNDEKILDLYEGEGEEQTFKAEALEQMQIEKINRIKEESRVDRTAIYDEAYKKAKGETIGKLERDIKDTFNVDSDKQGLDLIKDIIEGIKAKNTGKAKAEWTDDDIKKHDLYLKLERQVNELVPYKEKFDTTSNELEEFKKTVQRKEQMGVVRSRARRVLDSMRLDFSKDANRKANQINDLLDKLNKYDYQIDSNEQILMMENGKRMEDEFARHVEFNDFVKKLALEYYDELEQDPKGSSGNKKADDGNFVVPNNLDDVKKMLSDPKYYNDRDKNDKLIKRWKELSK